MKPVYAAGIYSGLDNPAPNITSNTIGGILSGGGFSVISVIFFFVGLSFFFSLVMAGWEYIVSTGDPKKISSATTRFINSLLGIAIALASFLIVRIFSQMIDPATGSTPWF